MWKAPSLRPRPQRAKRSRSSFVLGALCARCHSIAADGKSPHGHAPPFRVLPSRYPVANLAEAFAEGIIVTHKDMPQFVFDPDEIEAILSFIDSLAPEARTKPQPQRK